MKTHAIGSRLLRSVSHHTLFVVSLISFARAYAGTESPWIPSGRPWGTIDASSWPIEAISVQGSKESFRLSEIIHDQSRCSRDGDQVGCETIRSGRFRVAGRFTWQNIDIAKIDHETGFRMFLGELGVRVNLAEDITWNPGKRSARFLFGHNTDTHPERFVLDGRVLLRWTKTGFSFFYTGKIGPDHEDSALAKSYTGNPAGEFVDTVNGRVAFAGQERTLSTSIKGKLVRRRISKPEEDLELVTVNISGLSRTATPRQVFRETNRFPESSAERPRVDVGCISTQLPFTRSQQAIQDRH